MRLAAAVGLHTRRTTTARADVRFEDLEAGIRAASSDAPRAAFWRKFSSADGDQRLALQHWFSGGHRPAEQR